MCSACLQRVKTMTDSTESHLLDVNEHYDAVSDALLFERDTRYTHEKPCAANNRPSSRSRIRKLYSYNVLES